MNRYIHILLVVLILAACSEPEKKSGVAQEVNSASINSVDPVEEWLSSQGLATGRFADTTAINEFELWAYSDKLTNTDSAYYWYPSSDSSVYLLTNYNRETKKKINETDNVEFRFLDAHNGKVYIGLVQFDSTLNAEIDYYWLDNKTIYLLSKKEEKHQLIRLKMFVDSLWMYSNFK